MATCESTTPARLNRNSFPALVFPNWESDDDALYIKSGESFERAADQLVIERAQQLIAAGFCPSATVIKNPSQVFEFLTLQLGGRDDEVFAVMLLDNRRRFIGYEELFQGTVDTAAVPIRRVLSCVVKSRASAIIVAHNHPNGKAAPSRADIGLTDKLRRSLLLIDVELMDHVIIGEKVLSFADRGWIAAPSLALHVVP
jgi:DNA repair protein RadC